jgi:haloalkane dehalogenase
MEFIRTPEERFENLLDYPFAPHYADVDDGQGGVLRMHYLDEGEGEIILCLHGQPSWSYLYRKMIPLLTEAGYRVIAPDLIGFGKSDKPTQRASYTYANHVHWIKSFVEALDLSDMTLVGQDWGSVCVWLPKMPIGLPGWSRQTLRSRMRRAYPTRWHQS